MTYTEDQLTGWFDVETQNPWEPGVYEEEDGYYSWWDGRKFCGCWRKIETAIKNKNFSGCASNVTRWRGLAQNPHAKPKRSGNKRKVMYVVAHKATRCAEAVFSKKKNAQEYAKHLNFSVYITKIRFRTPEHN